MNNLQHLQASLRSYIGHAPRPQFDAVLLDHVVLISRYQRQREEIRSAYAYPLSAAAIQSARSHLDGHG